MNSVSMVVAERGANWLRWASALRQPAGGSLIVLAQDSHEGSQEFAQRVTKRLDRLAGDGVPVKDVAYVGGQRWDGNSRKARTGLLRSLSSLLTRSGLTARLYLDATEPKARRLMDAVAWALTDLTRGTNLSISVDAPA